jgi:diacylglycerol kinase family enzyme
LAQLRGPLAREIDLLAARSGDLVLRILCVRRLHPRHGSQQTGRVRPDSRIEYALVVIAVHPKSPPFQEMKVVALINAAAGPTRGEDRPAAAREALRAAGVEADVRPTDPHDLAGQVRRVVDEGADLVIAGGGDGTVSTVAGALAGTPAALAVLPMGTLNHFARDLHVPQKLELAARVIADAVGEPQRFIRPIDLGEVNGRCFVNNASIGLYPHIVSKREKQQERLGRNKWVAMVVAILAVFRRYPVLRVVLEVEGEAHPRVTPFVFVGNNRYEMNLMAAGSRGCLDRGELSLYFAHRTGRFGLLWLALRGLFGRLDQAKDFEAVCLPAFAIGTPKKTMKIAVDGEVTRMTPPLNFRVRPGVLRVAAPPDPAGRTPEGKA